MKPLLLIVTAVLVAMQPNNETKTSAYANILALDKAAASARRAEIAETSAENTTERQIAYKAAANAVKAYIPQWESGQTVHNLKAHFRLATYLDFADDTKGALNEYEICKRHPRLNDPNATWKDHPIAQLVEERINALSDFLGQDQHRSTDADGAPHPAYSDATSQSQASPTSGASVTSHSEGSVPASKPPI